MALWQESMIRLARSPALTAAVQGRGWFAGLAGRFVGGGGIEPAVATAHRLRDDGVAATLFVLGEYVVDPSVVAETIGEQRAAVTALAGEGLDVHLSVDPTQAGLLASAELCEANIRSVAEAVAEVVRTAPDGGARRGHDVLMIDMEDAGTTDATLRIHDRLRADGLPVAVTMQAYLHRSAADLHRLSSSGAWLRLVKGALAEPATVAARSRAEIDARYLDGLRTLLSPSAHEAGCYPSIATHDLRMIAQATAEARRNGWTPEEFEFELLYGVRPDMQRELARRGYRVRAYLPFGDDWFPYAVRRVGENPRNLRFVRRAVVRR